MMFIKISEFRSLILRKRINHIILISIYDLHEMIRKQSILFEFSRLSNQLLSELLIKETDCLNYLFFFMFYKHFFILLSELILRAFQKLIQSSHFFMILITEIDMKLFEKILNIIC